MSNCNHTSWALKQYCIVLWLDYDWLLTVFVKLCSIAFEEDPCNYKAAVSAQFLCKRSVIFKASSTGAALHGFKLSLSLLT